MADERFGGEEEGEGGEGVLIPQIGEPERAIARMCSISVDISCANKLSF